MDQKQKVHWIIAILLITIIIDVMGMGIVFPIMPELFTSAHSLLVPVGTDSWTKNLLYGLAMAIWSMGFFFGTPYIGDLSDKMGRKRAILGCLLFTALSYLLSVVAIITGSISIFMISRFMVGFFGGSFSVAQAVIADISPLEKKMKNMGYISLAGSLGMVVGPLFIILFNQEPFSSLGPIPVFIVAAILPFLNLLIFNRLFQETYVVQERVRFYFSKAFIAFSAVFLDKRTRLLTIGLFLFELSWGFYIQGIPLILENQYGLDRSQIAWFFSGLGLAFVTGIFVTQPRLVKVMSIRELALFAGCGSGLFLGLGVWMGGLTALMIFSFLFAVLEVSLYTGYMALFSNAVTEAEQGKAMGGVGAVIGGAWTVDAMLIGPLYEIHPFLLLSVAAVLLFLSGLCSILKTRNS